MKTTETLGKLSITPEKIAGDYFDGETYYRRHVELVDYANRGMKAVDYAKATGVTRTSDRKEYNDRYGDMCRFLGGNYPSAIQALTSLRALGILEGNESQPFDPRLLKPFDFHSKHFELLAMLSAFEFWTGSVEPSRSTYKTAILSNHDIADSEAMPAVEEFIEELKGRGICTPFEEKKTKRNGRVVAPVARLMFLMNNILGRKTQTDNALPEIFERAYNSLSNAVGTKEYEAAKLVLHDFLLAFFVIRMAPRTKRGFSGWLVSHQDETVNAHRRYLFKNILAASAFDDFKCRLSKEPHITRVVFSDMSEQTVSHIRGEFRDRIYLTSREFQL